MFFDIILLSFDLITASISRQLLSNIRRFLEEIFSQSLRMPENIIKTIAYFIRAIISMDWDTLKVFSEGIRQFISNLGGLIRSVLSGGINAVQRMGSVNADLVDGIISRIRGKYQIIKVS